MTKSPKFRIRRLDEKPDGRIPGGYFDERGKAEGAAKDAFGKRWAEEVEVYQYTSGTSVPASERVKSKLATYSLPAEDIAYVRELAAKQGWTLSEVIRRAIEMIRKKYGR